MAHDEEVRGSGVDGNAPVLPDFGTPVAGPDGVYLEASAIPEGPQRNLTAEQQPWVDMVAEQQQRIERMKHDLEVCWAERDRLRDALKAAIKEANDQAEARSRNRALYERIAVRDARMQGELVKLKRALAEAYPGLVMEDTPESTVAAAIKMVRVNHSSVEQMKRLAEYLRDHYPNAKDGNAVAKAIGILDAHRVVVEQAIPALWNDIVQPTIRQLMSAHALPQVLGPFHGLEHGSSSE